MCPTLRLSTDLKENQKSFLQASGIMHLEENQRSFHQALGNEGWQSRIAEANQKFIHQA